MRRSDASSSAPSRNGVTSGSHNPSIICPPPLCEPEERDPKKAKAPSEPAGPCDLRVFGGYLAVEPARKSNPRSGGFFRFQRAAAQHAATIPIHMRKVNEIHTAIHVAETCARLHCVTRFHQ